MLTHEALLGITRFQMSRMLLEGLGLTSQSNKAGFDEVFGNILPNTICLMILFR